MGWKRPNNDAGCSVAIEFSGGPQVPFLLLTTLDRPDKSAVTSLADSP